MTTDDYNYKSAYQQGYSDAQRDFRQKPSRNMKEIEEVMNCDADAETKCRMISNILTSKPHYFEEKSSEIKDLSKRVEILEKQIKEDKEEQLKKLEAELHYAKFRCALPTIIDMMSHN